MIKTVLSAVVKGVADYSNLTTGIDLDLSTTQSATGPFVPVTKVIGTAAADIIHGSDTPRQQLMSGDGDDMLTGVGYQTVFNGGTGVDTVSYADRYVGVNADLSAGVATNGDVFVGIENLIGGMGNNTLIGNDSVNRLIGGALGDLLDGGKGADYMDGGKGNDIYFVDNVGDQVVEVANGGANDKVYATISYALGENIETLTLAGDAGINGTGNTLANFLFGNAGANVLDGGAGNDTIRGGAGADMLTGGSGKDVFQFLAASDSTTGAMDHITDFVHGQDRLSFSSIDARAGTSSNDSFKFIGSGDFSHKAGELRYETHDRYTLVQGDTNGDGIADFSVSLDGYMGSLKSADFVL